MIGKTLAHYEILSQLGKGGMGEVYRALDGKLEREVALKFLPDELARDPERLARFEREAKLLASFAHPNIAALYGLEKVDGRSFLVMELAEGEDLSQRLRRGAIPLSEAMGLAIQIAEGIEAAHAKGIVHRDLKPANVMLGGDGRVKLLDFGLARAYQAEDASGDPALSPTITAAMTRQGVILGTAAYMSPEQARGKQVDKQTDVWAFGVLLFEMLTAHRLFDGETISDSIGAILHREPDWSLLPANTPRQVRRVLRRCLERDRATRLRDLGDARVELLEAQRNPEAGVAASGSGRNPWLQRGLGALAGIAVGIALMFFVSPRDSEPVETGDYRVFDLSVRAERGESQRDGRRIAIAPDGHALAYVHDDKIWVRNLDELEPREIEGSEEGFGPFWSPDGTQLGWFQGSKLLRAPASGGRAVPICAFRDRVAGGVSACWASDGRIFFSTGTTGIQVVNAVGGEAKEAIPPGEGIGDLHDPVVLPEGGGILVIEHPENESPSRLSLYRDGAMHTLFDLESNGSIRQPCYDPQGYILFFMRGIEAVQGLWALHFDLATGSVQGEPILVESEASEVDVADDGTLVYLGRSANSDSYSVVQVDREGQFGETLYGPVSNPLQLIVSPDGRRLALSQWFLDREGNELRLLDRDRGTETLLLDTDLFPNSFAWSWDGRSIWYSAWNRDERKYTTWSVAADGSRAPEPHGNHRLQAISPDRRAILELRIPGADTFDFARADSSELWLVPIDGTGEEQRLLERTSNLGIMAFAPSESYALCVEWRDPTATLYLTRYPSFEGRWQVAQGAWVQGASFAPDGSAIYYNTEEAMYRVSVTQAAEPVLGRSELLVEFGKQQVLWLEIDPRSDAFLAVVRTQEDVQGSALQRRGIRLVQNWTAKLTGL